MHGRISVTYSNEYVPNYCNLLALLCTTQNVFTMKKQNNTKVTSHMKMYQLISYVVHVHGTKYRSRTQCKAQYMKVSQTIATYLLRCTSDEIGSKTDDYISVTYSNEDATATYRLHCT